MQCDSFTDRWAVWERVTRMREEWERVQKKEWEWTSRQVQGDLNLGPTDDVIVLDGVPGSSSKGHVRHPNH